MSPRIASERPVAAPVARAVARHGWPLALAVVLAALVAMAVVAAGGLWAAGATDLPKGAFGPVVLATVVTAVGGTVELSGNAGELARTNAGLTAVPLSVTLVGALVVAGGFLRPLRHRAVAGARELAGWAARLAVLWLLALIGLALGARHTFTVNVGSGTLSEVTDLLDASPRVGFTTDVPLTVVFGLLWLAGILLLALLVSRGAPLPGRLLRFQASVRPAAYAMVVLVLAYVALALVIALVTMVTRGQARETLALVLLGLPNLAWLALTLGLGATWDGRVDGPFGLPVPKVLAEVLRAPDVSTLNVRTLAAHDGRAWWLVGVAAVLLLAAAFLMVVRSPARIRPWRHALHLAIALALTMLTLCLTVRVSAHYGLSLLGLGDLGGGLSGEVLLRPHLWSAVGLGALWGLGAGFLGASAARRVSRRGEVAA